MKALEKQPYYEGRRLSTEQQAFKHLQADEEAVRKAFRGRRKTDLKPLLKKSNHAAKLAAWEDEAGAIDPNVLRAYGIHESQLLQDIQAEEGWEQQAEEDEFRTMDMIRFSLIRELRDLSYQLVQEVNSRIRSEIKRRIAQIRVEIYMLQHAKHLAEKGDLQEEQLRKKSSYIYRLISWLTGLEKQEESIVQGRRQPAFAR